jgi:PQQ enzyme repeat/PQQ-like domain
MTKVLQKNITKVFRKSMKKTLSNTSIRAIALSLLFIVSGIGGSVLLNPAAATPNAAAPSAIAAAPAPAAATPVTQAEANWEFPNGNAFAQDYNPQTQINSSNVQYLGLSWIYPLPTVPTSLNSLFLFGGTLGMDPLIVNGTAYAITSFDEVLAFNVANGDVLWTSTSPLAVNQTQGEASGPVSLHDHDGNEWFSTATFGSGVSGPTLWFQGQDNRVFALNALSGKEVLNFSDYTGLNMVAGNNPASIYNGVGASNIVINQQLGILVSGHDAETTSNNGRGFFAGWNLNTNPVTMKWITYDVPPQPGSPTAPLNPYFDEQLIANMSAASTFFPGENGSTNGYTTPWEVAGGVLMNVNNDIVVNWKDLSSTQLNATLYNDWGQSDQSQQCLAITGGDSTGSTGSGWGGAWVVGSGQTAGMVFLGSNNKDPYDSPCTPGPDLWSASALALNVTTGRIIWGFQATPHDLWDYDCSWYQALANVTLSGVNTEVLLKTCKNGYLYEINAVTGNLIWAWSPPAGVVTPGPSRCPVCYMWNPLNSSQMNFDYPSAMTNCAPDFTMACVTGPQPDQFEWPSAIAGFEDEQAFDPATQQIYATSHIVPYLTGYLGLNASSYYSSAGELYSTPCPNCGFIDNNATTWDINAQNGQIVWKYTENYQGYRGQTDVSGNVAYLTESSGDILMLNAQSGQLLRDYYIGAPMAIGVAIGAAVSGQEYILVPVGTCSLEAVSTCPGTTPGDLVALSLQSAPPSTSSSVTVSQSVSTTVSVSTTTTTTTVVSSTGGATLYGVAAVAVIFIVISGYLAMRGRKPAS